jgi:hypothetical protein
MSMTAALGNVINWQERHQARRDHHPLQESDEDDEAVTDDTPSPSTEGPIRATNDNNGVTATQLPRVDDPAASSATSTDEVETILEDFESGVVQVTTTPPSGPATRPAVLNESEGLVRVDGRVSMQELEEERELARRRTSACVLLAVFVLFRLWIEAIAHGDFGLLMLCLVGTSWTARWIRYNREREEELDRRIQAQIEDGTTDVNRSELRILSFQAQLALAIMESQRNMMEGGYGHPDGHHGHQGVSDQAREQWSDFQFKAKDRKVKYGSVAQDDDLEKGGSGETEDVCTICLGEYEDGEQLVKLPCSHIYHEDCVSSWTSNHTRCPLCNYDLSQISGVVADDAGTTSTMASSLSPSEQIV